MNTVSHPTHKFPLLLRREFWEHKGGFLWAPAIAGGIALLFTVLAAIGASVVKHRYGNDLRLDGASLEDIGKALGVAGDMALLGGIGIALFVLGIVVFFYCLGCLYDDRKDRSVLFWKSLPVSDASTVASKAAWALALAPLLALAIGVLVGLSFWVVTALTTTVNGVPGASGVLLHSHPFRIVANMVAMVPLYALWALPTVGWLMFCSAAARSKPFLWAVLIPVLGCALVSFTKTVLGFDFDVEPMWYAIAFRGLLSVFPGSWLSRIDLDNGSVHGPEDLANVVSAAQNWALAGTADLWIGAAIGAALIYGAVRLRRWRDDN
ncbi:MAG TPA: ABC transporter permease [Luteimonas sp.]